jgi:hypothetical protein
MRKDVRTVFGFDADLVERMTQARFIASRAESFEQAAGVFSDLFSQRLTAAERGELLAMVEDIATLERPCDAQAEAIAVLRRRLRLAPAR